MICINYHNITTDDMLNGSGLRVVLWVAGCDHHCKNCHNPITHNPKGGIPFDEDAMIELIEKMEPDYIDGLTLSGGDCLHPLNVGMVTAIAKRVSLIYPNKSIWLYTGYSYEQVKDYPIMCFIDVLVDGKFIQDLSDINYPYAGSTNQRVIDVRKSMRRGDVVLYEER